MIEMHRAQRSFGDGLIAEEVDDLREDWMKYADWILDDETIVAAIYQALGKRHNILNIGRATKKRSTAARQSR